MSRGTADLSSCTFNIECKEMEMVPEALKGGA